MTVITPSYGPDFELCVDLNRSVLEFAPQSVRHEILVSRDDLDLFSRLAGPRTRVRCREELLPRSFLRIPRSAYRINLRRPVLPVRGWIVQQIVKLAAAAASEDDVALIVDSDVQFVRDFGPETFFLDGAVRFYRGPERIGMGLPRHVIWHDCARELLGQPRGQPPFNDYISAMIACDPAIVRRMFQRIESTTGRAWASAIAGRRHFSEWILYGVFVDELAGPPPDTHVSDDPLCCAYWPKVPLDLQSALDFFSRIRSTDVAAMISSKSKTPLAVKRAAFAEHHSAKSRWN